MDSFWERTHLPINTQHWNEGEALESPPHHSDTIHLQQDNMVQQKYKQNAGANNKEPNKGSFVEGTICMVQAQDTSVQNTHETQINDKQYGHNMVEQREDFFWEEILQMEGVPFEELLHLSEAEVALLPGLDNLGDYLKDQQNRSGEEEDEYLTFTRAKTFEMCFGLGEKSSSQPELPQEIFGSETLQVEINKLIKKYSDRFCRQVQRAPATLPPFDLHLVADEKWSTSRSNMGRPRPLGPEKSKELVKQVEKMLAADVVEHSTALHYSQVHMVPKKPTGWRFALD